jgi:DnaJ-domain-containing protein 1
LSVFFVADEADDLLVVIDECLDAADCEYLKGQKPGPDDGLKKCFEAFRREISKYHPDRVEGLGIELRELADQKAKEVNRAYALAKEQRRFG